VNQLIERTSWSPDQVQALLDEDKTVCIGIEEGHQLKSNRRGGRRVHSLAYDTKHEDWYVVVWDEANGEVVTILSVAFHDRCAWRVSDDALRLSKTKVVPDPHAKVQPVAAESAPAVTPPKYRVSAMVRVTPSHIRAMFIGRFDLPPPIAVVREKLKEHSLDHLEIGCIIMRKGRNADPITYPVVGDRYAV
jgi:hypothetical protein